MSGNEIFVFIFGFVAGAGLVLLISRLRRVDHTKSTELIKQQFQLLAHQIFEEKSKRFDDVSTKNLSLLLDPLKERIKDFEHRVEQTYAQERSERGVLKGELNKLLELNVSMSKEARNLSRALKGESKTQGNWGEMILENILQQSGLRNGEEYISQGADMDLKSEDGGRLLPDIIVRIPGDKHLIVDSKVSLRAYEAYASSETDEDKIRFARQHVLSLETHINSLSGKRYQLNEKLDSPDFVMLFMPLEPAFALAFKEKPDLFQTAWEKNIALVSPTTLLTTLRTVASLWKQEKQQKNAIEIARRAGSLYDKFASLVDDLKLLGDRLDLTQRTHTEITKKLYEGKGNIISQVEGLKELGAKAERKLARTESNLEKQEKLESSPEEKKTEEKKTLDKPRKSKKQIIENPELIEKVETSEEVELSEENRADDGETAAVCWISIPSATLGDMKKGPQSGTSFNRQTERELHNAKVPKSGPE